MGPLALRFRRQRRPRRTPWARAAAAGLARCAGVGFGYKRLDWAAGRDGLRERALALQLAGRFADRTVRFGAVRYRSGPGHADFASVARGRDPVLDWALARASAAGSPVPTALAL